MKEKSGAECTRVCVKDGMNYALVDGQQVYTLKGNTSEIDKFAGQPATVKGSLSGKTISVESISATNKKP
jgi:hydroxyethylthiazole kinase-like sugar kinase family protein